MGFQTDQRSVQEAPVLSLNRDSLVFFLKCLSLHGCKLISVTVLICGPITCIVTVTFAKISIPQNLCNLTNLKLILPAFCIFWKD